MNVSSVYHNVLSVYHNISAENSSLEDLTQFNGCDEQLLYGDISFRYACGFGYILIFLAGVIGNVLVLWVILTTPDMRTTTNLYIFNLSLGDILMCVVAVPATPASSFNGDLIYDNILGGVLCKLLPSVSGISVYMSTFTLTAIAIERHRAILHPFLPKPGIPRTVVTIVVLDIISLVVCLPYAYYMELSEDWVTGDMTCNETWDRKTRLTFGMFTNITQFVIPFATIIVCYIRIIKLLNKRNAEGIPGFRSAKERLEEHEKAKKVNWMLIIMVVIFGVSWFPLNLINFIGDLDFWLGFSINCWSYYFATFFIFHVVAMTSTCYYPFIYAFFNSQYRKEFGRILPCLGRITFNKKQTKQTGHEDVDEVMMCVTET